MKRFVLLLVPCLILSLLVGCTTPQTVSRPSTVSKCSSASYMVLTYEELVKMTSCLVRATCTDKVLNRDTNHIDTTFQVTEVYYGDIVPQTLTFELYPRDTYVTTVSGEPLEYVSEEEVSYESGREYLLFLEKGTDTSAGVKYYGAGYCCIPYDNVQAGMIVLQSLPEQTEGMTVTPETTAEDLIAYARSLREKE